MPQDIYFLYAINIPNVLLCENLGGKVLQVVLQEEVRSS